MRHPNLPTILGDLKHELLSLYGRRLDRIVLFGSQARGDATPTSEIEVLVVLTAEFDDWQETEWTGAAIARLALRHHVVITRLFATAPELASSEFAIFQPIRREGVQV